MPSCEASQLEAASATLDSPRIPQNRPCNTKVSVKRLGLGLGLCYLTIVNKVARGAPYGVAKVRFLAAHFPRERANRG
jgi:hypothetical protein